MTNRVGAKEPGWLGKGVLSTLPPRLISSPFLLAWVQGSPVIGGGRPRPVCWGRSWVGAGVCAGISRGSLGGG